ncbi:response regulator [Hartmannibacter diazotrophicus]|uniref:response regulator n=1 Tax=Hartmannibacter diazotrophicus TaxID=1482074 RepID=UPI0012FD5CDB|nr:response regulator [Hartmannibacter diazotrophicus]
MIEDDAAVADALVALCAAGGCDLQRFHSAEAFLATVKLDEIDVVVVDLGLPGISGREVIQRLQDIPDGPRVVVISGKSDREIRHELRGLHQTQFLRKPPTGDWLGEIIPSAK